MNINYQGKLNPNIYIDKDSNFEPFTFNKALIENEIINLSYNDNFKVSSIDNYPSGFYLIYYQNFTYLDVTYTNILVLILTWCRQFIPIHLVKEINYNEFDNLSKNLNNNTYLDHIYKSILEERKKKSPESKVDDKIDPVDATLGVSD